MRWSRRHKAHPPPSEGIEKAKVENEIAHQIDGHIDEILDNLAARMIANGLGKTIQRATGGH